jgi:hypothetical protein
MAKVLHASYSGYFPACIETAPTNKSNLVGGTLEQIMELYWKVKSWKLDYISGSETFNYDEDSFTYTYMGSEQSLGSVYAINETQLVCNPYRNFVGRGEYTAFYPSGDSDTLYIGVGLNGNFYKENKKYYMEFYFDSAFWSTTDTGYPVGSLTVNGLLVPLYGDIDGIPPQSITGNMSASISPSEYWPYEE